VRTATKVTLVVVTACVAVACGLVWRRVVAGPPARRLSQRALSFVFDNPQIEWREVSSPLSVETREDFEWFARDLSHRPNYNTSRYVRYLLTPQGMKKVTATASASTLTIGEVERKLGPAVPVTSGVESAPGVEKWYRYDAVDIGTREDGTVITLRVDGPRWHALGR